MNVFIYDTIPWEEGVLEGHREYADIHIVLDGCEQLGYADCRELILKKPYDRERDYTIYEGETALLYKMYEGNFAIVFPEDIHMPKLQMAECCSVKKAVVKVKVSDI